MDSPLQTILEYLGNLAQAGMTTKQLDESAERMLRLHNCEPAFLGYQPKGHKEPFPSTLCVSINNEVIHGLPSDRKLEDGDVVKLDLGLKKNGQYDDGAITVIIGKGSSVARRLVKATKEALDAGCKAAKAGNTTHDIAKAIKAIADREGFGIVEDYGGHGIGEELHMEPHIPNAPEGDPVKLEAGKRIAIEPMFASKKGRVFVEHNGWTVKLVGGGVAAHFERTVTVS
jgi:methionyl aminopeptidase